MWSPPYTPKELKTPEERRADDERLQRWLGENKDNDIETKPASKPSSPWNPEDCL